jgi:hypothetical protein
MGDGPALVCPACGSRDVDVRRGLLCATCAEADQGWLRGAATWVPDEETSDG